MRRASTPVFGTAERKIAADDTGIERADVVDIRHAVGIGIRQDCTAIGGGRTSLVGAEVNAVRLTVAVAVAGAGMRTARLGGGADTGDGWAEVGAVYDRIAVAVARRRGRHAAAQPGKTLVAKPHQGGIGGYMNTVR